MKAPSIASRILLVLVATLLLAASATLAWGVVLDYQARGFVPKGVTVVGRDLSGMTEAQARAAIEEAVSTPMLRPLTITGDAKSWSLDPQGIVVVDTESMLDSAYLPRQNATLVERLASQIGDKQLPADIKPVYTVDTGAVAAWVTRTAATVNRKPVDSERTIHKYKFKISPSAKGVRVNQRLAATRIAEALSAETALSGTDRTVTLPIKLTDPEVDEKSFKRAIIVSLRKTRIYLYKGAKLVKTYRCAPGRPAFPTPTGEFHIVRKLANAPWINPGSDWAKDMPDRIAAGPSNPMGVRKIGIDYPGIFFHGIPPGEYSSIGTHASHGCMRMMPSDVLDMFGRVKVGDPVFIKQ